MSNDQFKRAEWRTWSVVPMNCLVWFSKGMFPFQQVAVVDAMDTIDNRNWIVRFHSLDDACRHALHWLCLSTVQWACFAPTSIHAECNLVDSSYSDPSTLPWEKERIQPKHELAEPPYRTFADFHYVRIEPLVSLSLHCRTEWKYCLTKY